ncbi:nuclear transport factor 2 family protein [Saccharopolyspora erythraea]|uniref:ester cyclase n=1 Tax=Saccharopolyspora erythraea TaxID=1836 RepID=UPI001BAA7E50|nr:nuclear transport factor 2 family protein [Saccharopolyspora erythraea]QUH01524.1 nuclear transport factor 2 family protein [Saccharopolyspora erythraea]
MTADVRGKVLFEKFVDLWNGDLDYADTAEFIADDVVVHSAQLARYLGFPDSNQITTRQGLLDWVTSVRTLLDGVRFRTVPGPIQEGDLVAGGYVVTGTYAGGAPNAQAEPGTPVEYTGMSITRIENGKIAEYWVLSDALGLLSDLKAIHRP